MLPLLQSTADGKTHTARELRDTLAAHFDLTPEELDEMLPSGTQKTFVNRVDWAKTYLSRAHLLKNISRGNFTITKRGRQLLGSSVERIDMGVLMQYPEFRAFRTARSSGGTAEDSAEEVVTTHEKDTPEEWAAAEKIFTDNGANWEDAKPLLEQELEALIDEDENDTAEETEEELDFGPIDLGPDVDAYDVLDGLARLACSDKELTWQEIDVLHKLGESMNVGKELVTAALVKAAAVDGVRVVID